MKKSLVGFFHAYKNCSVTRTIALAAAFANNQPFTSSRVCAARVVPNTGKEASVLCYPFHNERLRVRASTLQSSTSHSLAAVIFATSAAVIFWALSTDNRLFQEISAESLHLTMATQQVPSGHLGNLSADQEKKLQEFWQTVAKVSGWAENGSVDATKASSEPEPEQASGGGWGFGILRKSETADKGAEDDKFGLAKQYNDILARHSPESIRESTWEMTKHDHPDALALRFLRARKWDVQKAVIMFITAVNWRKYEMKVDDDVMKNGEAGALQDEKSGTGDAKQVGSDFLAQLRMGKSFLHGSDKEGRPICVVRVRLHHGGDQSAESIEKYTVHVIETARLLLQPPVETATIIFDMTGFTLSNMDYAPVKFMIKCFEANYPESLGAVLIQNAPWLFQGIWRIIKPWLDPVVAAKVHFTNGRSGLEEFIAPGQITKELGGDEEWEFAYIEPFEDENAPMKDTATRDSILKDRADLVKQFEESTKVWLREGSNDAGNEAREKRDAIAGHLKDNYWKLDPYIRARSLYDRQGVIGTGGAVNFYPKTTTEK